MIVPPKTLRIHPYDNIAVALADLPAGARVSIDDGSSLTLREAVPFGHKVALAAVAPGEPVVKYGEAIGLATQPITPGDHVHTHNLASGRAQSSSLPAFQPSSLPCRNPPALPTSQFPSLPIY